jgi:hypothetical protein
MRMKVYQVVDGTEFTKFVHSWAAPELSPLTIMLLLLDL